MSELTQSYFKVGNIASVVDDGKPKNVSRQISYSSRTEISIIYQGAATRL